MGRRKREASLVRAPLWSTPGLAQGTRECSGRHRTGCACVSTPSLPRTVTSPSVSSASSSSLPLAPDASISSSSAAGGKAVSSLAAAGVFFFFLRAFLSFSWDRTAVVKAGGETCLRPSQSYNLAAWLYRQPSHSAHQSGHTGQGYFYHRGFTVPCVPVGHWARAGPAREGHSVTVHTQGTVAGRGIVNTDSANTTGPLPSKLATHTLKDSRD